MSLTLRTYYEASKHNNSYQNDIRLTLTWKIVGRTYTFAGPKVQLIVAVKTSMQVA